MGNRGGIVLITDERLALIKRVKEGRTYYVLPGGQQEQGETIEQTAVREAYEELGIDVVLGELLVAVPYNGMQYYFLAKRVGGQFGTGSGEEFSASVTNGTYEAVFVPIEQLEALPIIPQEVVAAIRHRQVMNKQ